MSSKLIDVRSGDNATHTHNRIFCVVTAPGHVKKKVKSGMNFAKSGGTVNRFHVYLFSILVIIDIVIFFV